MKEIFERRAIRQFTNQEVTDQQIEQLLKAAMYAPSACNNQDWQFIVVRNQETRDKMLEISPHYGPIERCQVGIVVLGDPTGCKCEGFWQQDCAAATQNILLEAKHLGLGTVWMAAAPVNDRMDKLRKLLDIPCDIFPFCVIAIGYPDEQKEANDRYKPEKIHYEKF